MNPANLILGVDAGGTKTAAWLATTGGAGGPSVIGRGEAGPANLQSTGLTSALERLDQAIQAAAVDAHCDPGQVASACLGLAGAGREPDRQAIREWANGRELAREVTVTHDARLVLAAGTPGGCGVALVCGTGSFAFGATQAGKEARCGGWGPLFGDEGSGFAIAVAALRAAAHAADGRGAATTLLDRFLQQLGLEEPSQLVPAIYADDFTRAEVADLSRVVFTASDEHDAVAREIVQAAAVDLARMVAAVARQLAFTGSPTPLALAGGVLLHQDDFRHRLCEALASAGFRCDPIATVREPVAGALLLARQAIEKR